LLQRAMVSPPSPTSAGASPCGPVQLLREAATIPSRSASMGNGDGQEDGPSAGPLKCRPTDLGDHHARLWTFRTHWWFNKPLGVSPIRCSQCGWRNVGPDTLSCDCCNATLTIRLEKEKDTWLVNGRPLSLTEPPTTKAWDEALSNGHGRFCPWRSHEVMSCDPAQLSDAELVEIVQDMYRGLCSLQWYPVLDEGSNGCQTEQKSSAAAKTNVLEALARAGWECAGCGVQGTEFLRCTYCLRVVAVQSFSHTRALGAERVPDVTSDDIAERPAKVARCESSQCTVNSVDDAGSGTSAASNRELRTVNSPLPGLWTPRPWSTTTNTASGTGPGTPASSSMDPYALHHFYCPLYSRADDDLGPLAARIVRVHAADAAKKAGDTGALPASNLSRSAAERAEDLLRALEAVLPPTGHAASNGPSGS